MVKWSLLSAIVGDECALAFFIPSPPSFYFLVCSFRPQQEGRGGGCKKDASRIETFLPPSFIPQKNISCCTLPPPFPRKNQGREKQHPPPPPKKGRERWDPFRDFQDGPTRPTQISAELEARRHKKAAGRNTSFPTDRSEGGGTIEKEENDEGNRLFILPSRKAAADEGFFLPDFMGVVSRGLFFWERETSVSGEKNRRFYISSNA